MKPSLIPLFVAALSAPAFAQLNDAPPVDLKQVLQGLRQFKEQNEAGQSARLSSAYKQIVAATASSEAAAAFWTGAHLSVEIAGVARESAAARDWQHGEGEGFKARECANAARLHLIWLGLTLQHISDVETSKLLPGIIDYTKQVEADELAIGRLAEHMEKLVDRIPGAKGRSLKETEDKLERMAAGKPLPGVKEALAEVRAKLLHDKIMRAALVESPVAQKLQIVEMLGEAGSKKKKGNDAAPSGWEAVPGNVNGIYNTIVVPEFRVAKDPRLMDYWDMMLRKNQESIFAGMPAFDERKKTQVERPSIMWDRTQDMLLLGLKNRAVTEMFNIIKAYPQHPEAANWIAQLEQILAPSAPVPAPTIQGPGARGIIAPPASIPSATAPGNPPTAIIVPAAPAGVR